MAYEDFTTFTDVDDDSKLTVTASRITWDTYERDDNGYVYKDYGEDHFGDFEHWFDVHIADSLDAGDLDNRDWMNLYFLGLDNTPVNTEDCLRIILKQVGAYTDRFKIVVIQRKDDVHIMTLTSGEITTLPEDIYFVFKRVGTTITLDGYSTTELRDAAGDGDLVDLGGTGNSDTFQFLVLAHTPDSEVDGTDDSSGYIENLDLKEGGQLYEIYVDAVVKASAVHSEECTFNIEKDAAVTSQAVEASETTFNIPKDAIVKLLADLGIETTFSISKDAVVKALADVVVEKVAGQVIEIFKDAVVTAQATFSLESTFNINKDATSTASATANIETVFNVVKDAIIKASAAPQILGVYPISVDAVVKASAAAELQQTLGISKDAVVVAVSTSLIQSTFKITKDAVVKVLAEVSVVKEGEVKVTRLFLLLGNIAIQIQGD